MSFGLYCFSSPFFGWTVTYCSSELKTQTQLSSFTNLKDIASFWKLRRPPSPKICRCPPPHVHVLPRSAIVAGSFILFSGYISLLQSPIKVSFSPVGSFWEDVPSSIFRSSILVGQPRRSTVNAGQPRRSMVNSADHPLMQFSFLLLWIHLP